MSKTPPDPTKCYACGEPATVRITERILDGRGREFEWVTVACDRHDPDRPPAQPVRTRERIGPAADRMDAEERIQRIIDATPPELLADAAPALDGWLTTTVLREIAVYDITVEPKADEPITAPAHPT